MELAKLKIGNLIPGMQNIDIEANIVRISRRSFKKDTNEGQLCTVLLGDETGTMRLVLWNNDVERAKDFREGDILRVNGFVKQGPYGPEIRIGSSGLLERRSALSRKRASITELVEEGNYEIRAGLLHIFESSPFYEICSKCGGSLKEDENSYICKKDGSVEPKYAMRMTGIIDDGTGSIRFVMFKESVESILGMNVDQAKDVVLRKGVGELFKKARFGEYVFSGKLKKNHFFDRFEFVVNKIRPVNIEEEITLLSN